MRRQKVLSEVDCYCRCYGPGPGTVRIVRPGWNRPRRVGRLSGEDLRLLFEQRLDAREPEGRLRAYESEAA